MIRKTIRIAVLLGLLGASVAGFGAVVATNVNGHPVSGNVVVRGGAPEAGPLAGSGPVLGTNPAMRGGGGAGGRVGDGYAGGAGGRAGGGYAGGARGGVDVGVRGGVDAGARGGADLGGVRPGQPTNAQQVNDANGTVNFNQDTVDPNNNPGAANNGTAVGALGTPNQ